MTRGVSGDLNLSILLARSLKLPEVDLSIPPYLLGVWLGDGHSGQGVITCAVENAEHYRIQLAEIGEELHDPQPSRQGQTTISCSISKCLGTKRQEISARSSPGPWVTPGQAYQPRRRREALEAHARARKDYPARDSRRRLHLRRRLSDRRYLQLDFFTSGNCRARPRDPPISAICG